ncbi:vascular cell adhesion protein 1 isoform X2 [Larimichthys crocea]|uniref:vascular cell adhesion protein 1 isoform X2 n=1 Tax=Larimichthys crocea TaxID=215358 RepID=UPI000F5E7566|nr:vascular cell adhesion protein 1 isoform X2 [Larimichthys crocea]
MLFLRVVLLVVPLMIFLCGRHVSGCDRNCTDKPVFTPSRLVVKYGDPVAANCSVCEDCLDLFGLETPLGEQNKTGTTISWKASEMTEWDSTPSCYYTKKDSDDQCCSDLPITVYQPPDNVLIRFVGHTGPMFEGHNYTLQCEVQKVAPIENLIVIFYKGQTALDKQPYNGTNKKPVTTIYNLVIIPSEEDDGAQYWCEAKLELGPEGPQPPPVVISQKITASVYYKPRLQGSPHSQITIKTGSPLLLNCSAWGNPSPSYSWTLPSGSPHSSSSNLLAIDSVASADGGLYTCSVSNSRGTINVEFNVTVEEINIILIIVIVVVFVAVVAVGGLFYYHYYRTKRMGKYTLKDVFRLGRQHTAVPITE